MGRLFSIPVVRAQQSRPRFADRLVRRPATSVQRDPSRVRVNTQLIDAETGTAIGNRENKGDGTRSALAKGQLDMSAITSAKSKLGFVGIG